MSDFEKLCTFARGLGWAIVETSRGYMIGDYYYNAPEAVIFGTWYNTKTCINERLPNLV